MSGSVIGIDLGLVGAMKGMSPQNVRKTEFIAIEFIAIGDRCRALNESNVRSLMESIREVGLRMPISIRMADPEGISEPILVAGLHRLEAARRLGHDEIECFVLEGESEDQARIWEVSENLVRGELNVLDKSEHVGELVRLSNKLAQIAPVVGGRGRDAGMRKIARDFNLDRTEVQRAVKIASLSDEAKQAARDVGVDDRLGILLAAAKVEPAEQAKYIRNAAEKKLQRAVKRPAELNNHIDPDAGRKLAQWIIDRAQPGELAVILNWLEIALGVAS